jgi:uncharacterized delta-60 repeat protein
VATLQAGAVVPATDKKRRKSLKIPSQTPLFVPCNMEVDMKNYPRGARQGLGYAVISILASLGLVLTSCSTKAPTSPTTELSALAPGDLDVTFNIDGVSDTSLEGGSDRARGVVVQSDGKIVLAGTTGAGNFGLLRYTTDGSTFDTTFDPGDGTRIVDMGSSTDTVSGMVLQSDGKIVVVGETQGAWGRDVAVLRLNTNGSLDTTFSGDGKGYYNFNHFKDDHVTAVAMQGTKIVVVGWVEDSGSNTDVAVLRLNSDGSPDLTFNGNGVKRFSFDNDGSFSARAMAVAVFNNKVIVTGRAEYNANNWYFGVARLTNNGSLDNSFNGDGMTVFTFRELFAPCDQGFENEAFGVAMTPGLFLVGSDVGMVVVGRTNVCGDADVAVARLTSGGTLDAGFSGDGKRVLGDGNIEAARAVRTSGGLFMPGGGQTPRKITVAGYREGGADFQLMRLNWDGSFDTTFSGDGKLTTDFNASHDRAYAMTLSGGKIVVAGEARSGFEYEFAVARYNAQ